MNVKDLFDYDPSTGVLTWRRRPDRSKHWNTQNAGRPARSRDSERGGLKVTFAGRSHRVSRVVWEWCNGFPPPDQIDHINGNPFDNRISNLRLATHAENTRNKKQYGKWGRKGVYQGTGTKNFYARIYYAGKSHHLGSFATREEAHAAYLKAAVQAFGEFASSGERGERAPPNR